jgi:hypothetical protein
MPGQGSLKFRDQCACCSIVRTAQVRLSASKLSMWGVEEEIREVTIRSWDGRGFLARPTCLQALKRGKEVTSIRSVVLYFLLLESNILH